MSAAVAELQDDMSKVKQLTLLFDQRIRALEDRLPVPCPLLRHPIRLAKPLRPRLPVPQTPRPHSPGNNPPPPQRFSRAAVCAGASRRPPSR